MHSRAIHRRSRPERVEQGVHRSTTPVMLLMLLML
jgi:hypothetical protein